MEVVEPLDLRQVGKEHILAPELLETGMNALA
jgi:hypothetical protein